MLSFFPNSRFFGLEIGGRALRVLSMSGGRINGVHETIFQHNPWLKNGIRNKEGLAKDIRDALMIALPNPIGPRSCCCSIPEASVFSKTITVPKVAMNELIQAIPYEAADFLPLPLDEVYLDWQVEEVTTDANGQKFVHVFVVAAPKHLIDDIMEVAELAEIELLNIESEPFSIHRSIQHLLSGEQAHLILQIDNQMTTLAIVTRKTLRLTATTQIGTDKLANKPKESQWLLADEIQESLKYYQNRLAINQSILDIILTGTGTTIPHIAANLAKRLDRPTIIGYPSLKLPGGGAIDPRFNTVIGLALWHK